MLIEHLSRRLLELEEKGLRRQRRSAESASTPWRRVRTAEGSTRAMLSFCSNDYLGLATHPGLVAAVGEGARRFGAGSGASHLVSGHSVAHDALEEELARWMSPHIPGARALSFSTGYMANLALLTALGDSSAAIFADKLNHASLIDGALLSKAPLQRYAHGRLDLLSLHLERCTQPVKLIVTDAVFSMDGDRADLPTLLALAEANDAWLVVDDAHGFGVLGEQGRGSLSHFSLCSERLIYMGTLGKAAGLAGAFVAAHPVVIEWLVQAGRTYIYTTAQPPGIAHAACTGLKLIAGHEGEARRARLRRLVGALRDRMAAITGQHPRLGWLLPASDTPIQPLVVGTNAAAMWLAAALDRQGLWVPAIRPPTVPQGTARLRITLSASHSMEDVDALADGLARAAGRMQ
ncbi:MAG: 8-amino-7-oxononanoate synthase [Proteobacteria bacterium]|nr:8-amino-7-oxononanoate synthase [Pseudomonadota bacterium]